jgi:Ran GTPase-activating protein (RanGAP) involved in mRNA processing and transport
MGAILSLDLLKNDVRVEQARALVIILKEHSTLKSLCGNNGDETELDMSGKMKGAGDAIMLAPEIMDNGALSSLNISDNAICGWAKNGWSSAPRVYEGLVALCGSISTLQQLNLSSNNMGADGATHVADNIAGMGALTSLDISDNRIVSNAWIDPPQQGLKVGDLVDGNPINRIDEDDGRIFVVMLNGIKALADAIPDMGALIKLDISNNSIGAEQKGGLQRSCVASGIELAM